jgi:hypothetical protein
VDELLDKGWDRRAGTFISIEDVTVSVPEETKQATCSCGSGIPVQEIQVGDHAVTIVALPLIFARLKADGKFPSNDAQSELLDLVGIYNPPIPEADEAAYSAAILHAYQVFYQGQEISA